MFQSQKPASFCSFCDRFVQQEKKKSLLSILCAALAVALAGNVRAETVIVTDLSQPATQGTITYVPTLGADTNFGVFSGSGIYETLGSRRTISTTFTLDLTALKAVSLTGSDFIKLVEYRKTSATTTQHEIGLVLNASSQLQFGWNNGTYTGTLDLTNANLAPYTVGGREYAILTLVSPKFNATTDGTAVYNKNGGPTIMQSTDLKADPTYEYIVVNKNYVKSVVTKPGVSTTDEIQANSCAAMFPFLWNGGNATWTDTSETWTTAGSDSSCAYTPGWNVEFGGEGGAVTITSPKTVKTLKVTSGTWTFTGLANVTADSIYIAAGATLAVTEINALTSPSNLYGEGTLKVKGNPSTGTGHDVSVNLSNSTGFTGTVDFEGDLGLDNLNLANASLLTLTDAWIYGSSAKTVDVPVLFQGTTGKVESDAAVTFSNTVTTDASTLTVSSKQAVSFNGGLTVTDNKNVYFDITTAGNAGNITLPVVSLGAGAAIEQYTAANPTSTLTIGALTLTGDDATLLGSNGRFGASWKIGALTGANAILTFDDRHSANNIAVIEFGGVENAGNSDFTGEIKILQNEKTGNNDRTNGTGRHVAVVISDTDILSDAVINFSKQNTEDANGGSLVLGINTGHAKIAGLKSTDDNTIRTKVFSGTAKLGQTNNGINANLNKAATAKTLEIAAAENASYTYTGDVEDVNIIKSGAGTQTFTGSIADGTSVTVNSGTLAFTGSGTPSFNTVNVTGGALTLGSATVAGEFAVANGARLTATDLTLADSATAILAGSHTVSGITTLHAGASLTATLDTQGAGLGLGLLVTDASSTVEVISSENRWTLDIGRVYGEIIFSAKEGTAPEYTLLTGTTVSGDIVVNSGAKLQTYGTVNFQDASIDGAGTFRVQSGSTANVSGTTDILTAITVDGAQNGNPAGTLNLSGTVDLNKTIVNSGTVNIAEGTIIDLTGYDFTIDDEIGDRTYAIVSGSGTITGLASLNASNFMFEGGALSSRKRATISGGNVVVSGSVATLTWNGGASGTWYNDENAEFKHNDWTNADSNSDYFANNDNVIFATDGAVITLTDGVEAKSMTISENTTLAIGDGVTFAVNQATTIAENKVLTISPSLDADQVATVRLNATGAGTIVVNAAEGLSLDVGNDFMGTIEWIGSFDPARLSNVEGAAQVVLKKGGAATPWVCTAEAVTLAAPVVIDGTYEISKGNSLEAAVVTFARGLVGRNEAVLNLASGVTLAHAEDSAASGAFTLSGAGTFTADVAAETTLDLCVADGATVSVCGTNSGTLNLSGVVTFSGTNNGMLNVTSGTTTYLDAFASTGTINIDDGAVLDLGEKENLTIAPAGTITGTGTIKIANRNGNHNLRLNLADQSDFTGTVAFTGNYYAGMDLGGATKLELSRYKTNSSTIWHDISGGCTIPADVEFKTDYGLATGNAQTYTIGGDVVIGNNTVTLATANWAVNISGSVSVGENGKLAVSAGTLNLNGSFSGTIEQSGGTLNTTGDSTGTETARSVTITGGTCNMKGSFTGTITATGGTLTISKAEGSETGPTVTLTGSKLSSTVNVTAGATLDLTGNARPTNDGGGTLTISGGKVLIADLGWGQGANLGIAYNNDIVQLNNGGVFEIVTDENATTSNCPRGFNVSSGTGIYRYSGIVKHIMNSHSDSGGTGFFDICIADAATLEFDVVEATATNEVNKVIGKGGYVVNLVSTTGAVEKTGSGTLIFNTANLYSGGTTVRAGTLVVGHDNALGAGGVTVGANGTLDLNGHNIAVASLVGAGSIVNTSASPVTLTVTGAWTDFSGTIGANITLDASLDCAAYAMKADGFSTTLATPTGVRVNVVNAASYPHVTVDTSVSGTVMVRVDRTGGANLIVMPLGDSITHGSSPGYNYRKPLFDGMYGDGWNVRSTGFWTNSYDSAKAATYAPVSPDCRLHNGISGQRIMTAYNRAGYLQSIDNYLDAAGYPDIITMMIGTNDENNEAGGGAVAFSQWKALVTRILRARPNTHLIVSPIIARQAYSEPDAYRTTYNASIRSLFTLTESSLTVTGDDDPVDFLYGELNEAGVAAFGESARGRLHMASMEAAIKYIAGNPNLLDSQHPNKKGYARMAAVWRAAIEKIATREGGLNDALAVVKAYTPEGDLTKVTVVFNHAVNETDAVIVVGGQALTGVTVSPDKRRLTGTVATALTAGTSVDVSATVSGTTVSATFKPVGLGAAANVPAEEIRGYVKVKGGTLSDASSTAAAANAALADADVVETVPTFAKQAYFLEIARAGEEPRFVWVAADAFQTADNTLGIPTTTSDLVQKKIGGVRIVSNAMASTEATDEEGIAVFNAGGLGTATSTVADIPGGINASINGGRAWFDWNDKLTVAESGYGTMQLWRLTGGTGNTDPNGLHPATLLFAYNRFTYADSDGTDNNELQFGDLARHHRTTSSSADDSNLAINGIFLDDYTKISNGGGAEPFRITAYTIRRMEVWVKPKKKSLFILVH